MDHYPKKMIGELSFDLSDALQRSMHHHAVFGHCYYETIVKINDAVRRELSESTPSPLAEKIAAILHQEARSKGLELLRLQTDWWGAPGRRHGG